MFKQIYATILIVVMTTPVYFAQGESNNAKYLDLSKVEKTKQFQFLAGHWKYATADKSAHGSSQMVLQVNNTVIADTTYGNIMGQKFIGQALFVFDEKEQIWRHHWIDSLGSVLKTTVKLEHYAESKVPALVGELEYQGTKLKHIWYNISAERFETDLLVSNDDGKTYKLARRMPYIRDSQSIMTGS